MSDVRDKSPWYGTAEDGLRWILRDETCKTEQIELVAEKALEKIKALLSLSADKDREIESLQRERDEARANYTRDVPEFTKRIESLQRENEELRTDRDNWKGWKQAASRAAERLEQENAELRAKQMTGPAITPEMRERVENLLAELTDVPDEAEWKRRNESRDMMIIPGLSFRMCWALRDLLGEQG